MQNLIFEWGLFEGRAYSTGEVIQGERLFGKESAYSEMRALIRKGERLFGRESAYSERRALIRKGEHLFGKAYSRATCIKLWHFPQRRT